MNPLDAHEFDTQSDTRKAVNDLFDPLTGHFSDGNARVDLGATGAHFPAVDVHLEGFSRPLWGIAPLVAGGGSFDYWQRYREGLINGTDPEHPEYWGPATKYSQKCVEMAAIGVALAMVPEKLWTPLDPEAQHRVATWLSGINDVELPDNNWQFFRVLTNVGLRAVDAPHDWEATQDSLDDLERYALDGGWYSDGDGGHIDYYIPWAMHTYGLLYSELCDDADPARCERFRDRARSFARNHRHWFDDDGAALPYGRSLTYRFAQAAFWGALAVADLEALPWGEVRGLWARNLRWWSDRPIFSDGGLLTIGHGYPSLKMSESYNSPCSPYWAMKAFLPLACDADHPFWQATETPIDDRPDMVAQPEPGMVICHDDTSDHHYGLLSGQHGPGDKYTGFTTSTTFGMSVRGRSNGLDSAGHDGNLAVRRSGDSPFRIRSDVEETAIVDDRIAYSAWSLWDGFQAETWLVPALPWHVRIHRLETEAPVETAEGGFALSRRGDDDPNVPERKSDAESAHCRYPDGFSGIRSLQGGGEGAVVNQEPNTNLFVPRTVVPTIRSELDAGTHWLVTAVTAAPPEGEAQWDAPPTLAEMDDGLAVLDAAGDEIARCDGQTLVPGQSE